jgi:multidrug efflux system membrane fusion protein
VRCGRAIALALTAVALVALGGWKLVDLASARAPAAAPPPPVPINAAPVKIADVPAIVPALGTVESIDTVNVMPQVNGRIVAIYFEQGDEVKAGQPLFLIDPRPFQAALNQAQGQLAHDQAALAEAKMDLARFQRLTAENAIATQTEQDQIYVVGQDEGTVKVDEANVATATLNLAYCHIDAPVAGLTGALQVDLGNYVQATSSAQSSASGAQTTTTATTATATGITPLVTITQMQPIYVSFSVPETELNTIRQNQAKGALEVDAYSQAGKPIAKGKLTLISNQVRHSDRHDHARRHLRQPERAAVAKPVRRCALGRVHPPQRGHRSRRGSHDRPDRGLCLRRRRRQQSEPRQCRGDRHAAGHRGYRQGPKGGRGGRH